MRYSLFLLTFFIALKASPQITCGELFDFENARAVKGIEEQWDDVTAVVSTTQLFGREVEIRRVDRSQLIRGKVLFGESIGGDSAIFIGLNSAGHMYLVANVYRYDGKFAFEKPALNTRSSNLDRGLVVRIDDPDGKLQDQIIAYFKNNEAPRAIDCSAGACKVVGAATGVKLASTVRETVLPSQLLRRLVIEGVKNPDGSARKAQLFALGNGDPTVIIQAADRASRKYVQLLGNEAVKLATVGIGIASLVSGLLFDDSAENSKQD